MTYQQTIWLSRVVRLRGMIETQRKCPGESDIRDTCGYCGLPCGLPCLPWYLPKSTRLLRTGRDGVSEGSPYGNQLAVLKISTRHFPPARFGRRCRCRPSRLSLLHADTVCIDIGYQKRAEMLQRPSFAGLAAITTWRF